MVWVVGSGDDEGWHGVWDEVGLVGGVGIRLAVVVRNRWCWLMRRREVG